MSHNMESVPAVVNPRSVKNRRMKDRQKRKKLREKLLSEGVNEQLVEKIIEQRRWEDLVARVGPERARSVRIRNATYDTPDDSGYEPELGDPLLRGPGRVDGIAAKVVRRDHTITKFQYDQAVSSE